MPSECKSSKTCVHCNEYNSHHRSLCPKKFKVNHVSNVHLSGEAYSVFDVNSQSTGDNSSKVEGISENVLISSGELVLMQTAKAQVCNSDHGTGIETRILFDSGSQRTYISENLDDKLKL